MELRPYQEEARQAVESQWEKGLKKTLLVLPTGCGKTIVFAKVAEDQVRHGSRVLILAHRGELLEQAADKIGKATRLGCAVEKADQTCIGSWFRVVVGSVQSLMREKRLSQFPEDYFGTIIIDEAHHCISGSYQKVLGHFPEARVLGVTATPDRGDMRNLGEVFESLAYEYTLPRAIREGYLSPIKAMTIPLKLDLSGVALQSGDFKAGDLATALDPYLYQIAEEMAKYCRERKTVVFLPLVKTSQKFRDILLEKGFRAAEVNGESKDRAEILERLRSAENTMAGSQRRRLDLLRQNLETLRRKRSLTDPMAFLQDKRMLLGYVQKNLSHAGESLLAAPRRKLGALAASVDALSPLKVLGRGYAMVTDQGGQVVRSVRDIQIDDDLSITLGDGTARCRVEETVYQEAEHGKSKKEL